MRVIAILLTWWFAAPAFSADAIEGSLLIDQAAFLLSEETTPPSDDHPAWQNLSLPDDWRVLRPSVGGNAWYRVSLSFNVAPNRLWAIYLPRVNMNAAVWLNGQLLGSAGRFEEPMARNWNRPLYFPIPNGLLKSDANVFHIRLKADAWAFGYLGRLYVGPDEILRAPYESRYFVQITSVEAITFIMLALSTFTGIIWVRRRQETVYGWFALSTLTWAFNNTNLFLRDIPVSLQLWEWAANISLVWMVVLLTLFVHRYLGLVRRRLEAALIGAGAGASLVLAIVPDRFFFPFIHSCYVATLVLVIYMIGLMVVAYFQRRTVETAVFAAVGVVLFFLGIHDLLIQFGWEMSSRHLLHQGSVVLFVFIGGMLVNRFVHALKASETLTHRLEQRVEEKHRELARNYERLRAMEHEQVLTAERERIMRDMHDGMGGQLVATLAMVDSGEANREQLADALRGALDDLRLMIDSLDPVEEDLTTVLGILRSRTEQRLTQYRLKFDWKVGDLPPIPGMGPQKVLQVMRILQEAICNVIKHAHARTITVTTGEIEPGGKDHAVFVEVRDDGVGLPATIREGRGLGNMRHRAAAIGASLELGGGQSGTTVRLVLPLAALPN